MDVLARFVNGLNFSSFQIIALNYFAGGLFNQFWFFVILPNLYFRKKWITQVLVFLVLFGVFIFIKVHLLSKFQIEFVLGKLITSEFLRVLIFQIFTSAIWGFYIFCESQREKNKLEMDYEVLLIQHKSLQLSSHFLNNSLTQFASEILPLSKPLFNDFLRFSDLISYSYKETLSPNFLFEEIKAIEIYIGFQRKKFGERLQFLMSNKVDPDLGKQLPLPKWTMMTLVENIFKHGNCFVPDNPCVLNLDLRESNNNKVHFTFYLKNSRDHNAVLFSTGFGINTVNRILKYHFKEKYHLQIEKNEKEFQLKIDIEYGRIITNRAFG
ncbi:histidine kinase [Algoriphagus aquaeductus]|uniref:Histidine kinase n=2 Tax=Algoriphagus aquaeductus TaxID=475299 RepID=A0A326RK73_9BACT|nr:histidine kinase [Algoriphagus aquaeductus]